MIRERNYKVFILSGLIVLNFLLFFFIGGTKLGELKIYFFDVGQGDSIFIETEDDKQVLIDGGPDNKLIQRLSEAMPFWDRTIDLVILTHTDNDHLVGLLEVLKRYKVKGIIETGIECKKPECLAWKELKEKEKAAVILVKLGEAVVLDKNTKILILNPLENLSDKKVSKTNNTSIVAKLIYGSGEGFSKAGIASGYSVLLAGDIEKQIEEKLILAGIDIDTDYLKIPHHGSKTSTTEEFLENTSPLMAFISLGRDNPYGHPHQEVTERLEKRSIKYYRTDELGTILLSCRLNEPCRVELENRN